MGNESFGGSQQMTKQQKRWANADPVQLCYTARQSIYQTPEIANDPQVGPVLNELINRFEHTLRAAGVTTASTSS